MSSNPGIEPSRLPLGAVLSGHVDRLRLFRELMTDVTEVTDLPGPAIRGLYDGTELAVIGTGMGGPVTARAATALVDRGCQVMIRAGGAGPVQANVRSGDLIVASAAVRHEGASAAFLGPGEPAFADPVVVKSLIAAARRLGVTPRVGIVHSKDSFFGEFDPDSSPQAERLHQLWNAWRRLGVLGSEMEAATLFSVARARGIRSGAVVRVNDVANDSGSATDTQLQLCTLAAEATVATVRETSND